MQRLPVLVFDAHRQGFKHSLVNAALLHAVELGFPDHPVRFLADPRHRPWVEEALDMGPPGAGRRIEWGRVPGSGLPGWNRLVGQLPRGRVAGDLTAYLGAALSARRARMLLVTSVTSLGVAALVSAARLCPRTPVLTVVHQVNDILGHRGSRPLRGRRLLASLRRPLPRNLRFLATTRSIVERLGRELPDLASGFEAFDLPYFWHSHSPPTPPDPAGPLRFGFFGTAREESFAAFSHLAARVTEQDRRAVFLLVGFVRRTGGGDPAAGASVEGVGELPLPLPELRRRADRVHYAVWTRPPAEYRLRLSASLLDALSYVRPVIAVRSPFVEHCFEVLGDIGYLCDDLEEVEAVTCSLLRAPPIDRYRSQCETILRERWRFDPTTAGALLSRLTTPGGEGPGTTHDASPPSAP